MRECGQNREHQSGERKFKMIHEAFHPSRRLEVARLVPALFQGDRLKPGKLGCSPQVPRRDRAIGLPKLPKSREFFWGGEFLFPVEERKSAPSTVFGFGKEFDFE